MEMGKMKSVEDKYKEHRVFQWDKSQLEHDVMAIYDVLDERGLRRPYSINDVIVKHQEVMRMMEERPIYRVSIHDRTGKITTHYYDLLENFAPELKKEYNSVNDLPKWAQERLAVLMVLDPTIINNDIENVGRRISRNVYWLYKEIENGDNPRGES